MKEVDEKGKVIWMYATADEIEAMTFDEAAAIVERHIASSGEKYGARAHFAHALQMILDSAIAYKNGNLGNFKEFPSKE